MISTTPFHLIAQYYINTVVPHIGRSTPQEKENQGIDGFLFVTDGSEILTKAKNEMACRPTDGFKSTTHVSNDNDFLEVIAAKESYSAGEFSSDIRVVFYNGPESLITDYRGEITNNYRYRGIPNVDKVINKNLPNDYGSVGATIGARTGAFILTPAAFKGVKTVVLNESGNGSVSHADYNGLVETITIAQNTIGTENPLFIYKRYRDESGNPTRDETGRITLHKEYIVDKDFVDVMTGQYVGPYTGPLVEEDPVPDNVLPYSRQGHHAHNASHHMRGNRNRQVPTDFHLCYDTLGFDPDKQTSDSPENWPYHDMELEERLATG
jgi:hypothetical protein